MQIDYDPQADTIYIQFREEEVDDTLEVSDYIYVDVDKDGVPLGLEVLFARRVLGQVDLASITANISQPAEPVGSIGSSQ
jgi:uncharacterized protein YuzE